MEWELQAALGLFVSMNLTYVVCNDCLIVQMHALCVANCSEAEEKTSKDFLFFLKSG
jgi:hypothetical protein